MDLVLENFPTNHLTPENTVTAPRYRVDLVTVAVRPACSIAVVDTTAAGDAFNGALAVALAEGASLEAAADFANRAAALSTTREGAQPSLPTRPEVDAFARDLGGSA